MNTNELVDLITNEILDTKGLDVVAIDVAGKSSITDVMMICTGTSNRHTNAIAEKVNVKLKKNGVITNGIEGENPGDWVLLDCGDVILHVMQSEARLTYELEKLYENL
ncbi:MAG: ribosome silencing factor [Ruminobacter sp.]|nr:ribosome silencing factor [Ruminobacter sp.]